MRTDHIFIYTTKAVTLIISHVDDVDLMITMTIFTSVSQVTLTYKSFMKI